MTAFFRAIRASSFSVACGTAAVITKFMYSSAMLCLDFRPSVGCHDKTSAGFLLPAVYSTLKSYSCCLSNHCSILAGGLDKGFANISSSALWSVYNVNGAAYRYKWKYSIPQTIARASFSV